VVKGVYSGVRGSVSVNRKRLVDMNRGLRGECKEMCKHCKGALEKSPYKEINVTSLNEHGIM
jgi:hypothetical protein